ncbi:sortase [Firmicutes bacterium M10-2]|nr:sortase [Firmicutes bacterium M10-2]
MKKKTNKILFVFGVLCAMYPLIVSGINAWIMKGTLSSFQKQSEQCSSKEKQEKKDLWLEYNMTKEDSIYEMIQNDGIIARLSIPCISLDLPIYAGTSGEILNKGIGHWKESDLPCGMRGQRSVLSGHRGLSNHKMFTRLDELKKGDLFSVQVHEEVLWYEVERIEVIAPEEVEKLKAEFDKDLVSLVTCTPYGINTHRLVVTGERTTVNEAKLEACTQKRMPSLREGILMMIPCGLVILALVNRKGKKKCGKKS